MGLNLRTSFAAAATLSVIAACTAQQPSDPRLSGPRDSDLGRLASPPAPPRLVADDAAGVADAAFAAARIDAVDLEEQNGFRRVEISAIPYLRGSPEGALFLDRAAPRALARGEPAAFCPISGVSSSAAVDRREAAATAIETCLQARTNPDCACRLLAVDDLLLAPRTEFIFAPVVSAYVIGSSSPPLTLVAEAEPPDAGRKETLLRDPRGVVARLTLEGSEASMTFDGVAYQGVREPFGYRRGRVAERVRLTGPAGERLIVLIGVERRDALKPS